MRIYKRKQTGEGETRGGGRSKETPVLTGPVGQRGAEEEVVLVE